MGTLLGTENERGGEILFKEYLSLLKFSSVKTKETVC